MRIRIAAAVAVVTAATTLAASPGLAHDHRLHRTDEIARGALGAALPGALAGRAEVAAVSPGKPAAVPFSGTLTKLPVDPNVGYPSPTEACAPDDCRELQVTVPKGAKTLYGTIGWNQPSYYFALYALSPDMKVVGRIDGDDGTAGDYAVEGTDERYTKNVGNERTITRAQFTVKDPAPGTWTIRARAIFANKTKFDGVVAVSADPAVELQRLNNRDLADRFLTQHLRVNVVFVGRELTKAMVAGFRDRLPDQYRPTVLTKNPFDCTEDDNEVDCQAGTLVNWHGSHYGGTMSSKDDRGDLAGGVVPYFEAMRFKYSYKFFQADDRFTGDLFAHMAKITKRDQPLAPTSGRRAGPAVALTSYNATRGIPFRGPDALVTDTTVADKMDPWLIEDWLFAKRGDSRYARSFLDVETGTRRDGRFINPDAGAYYDPWYDKRGKDLDRIPQGPATSFTYFVMDTFTGELAKKHFRRNVYHSFDVSNRFPDPDTGAPDGRDDMRAWGGRYRFFFLDIGAMPNSYETIDAFTNQTGGVADSATWPDGDPPIWEVMNNPQWNGIDTLVEKTARDVVATMLHRFTASYLYRPRPADVYFVANNNWSDYYSRPAPGGGGGVSWTDLSKIYDANYVERNLESALPGATFTTERGDRKLRTYRYLGCASQRAGSASTATGLVTPGGPYPPKVMVPDPACPQGDKFQQALEDAKAQGDDVAGAGANAAVVSAGVVRRFVEQNRAEIAPLRPGQFTLTNISVVFPGVMTWTLPAIVGGIAFGTPNSEAWGVLQNVNDRVKPASATDCSKSATAPECAGSPLPVNDPGSGFSYTIAHEASHFLGLTHPHDSVIVEKNDEGEWDYYKQQWSSLPDFSQAPTTYAGAHVPYGVIDQDIIQRGHIAEFLQMAQDTLDDAYLRDGVAGRRDPSPQTRRKEAESNRWRTLSSRLFACGDYLHSEYAMRNAYLASQGVFGPVVKPRRLQPGERVLFEVRPQVVAGPDGTLPPGCAEQPAGASGASGAARGAAATPAARAAAAAPVVPAVVRSGDALAAVPASSTGGRQPDAAAGALALAALVAVAAAGGRRRRRDADRA